MNLRPRYSLLSLLVVTALVAAGVMYFRVPHRALVSNPPTDEERLHLEQNFFYRGMFTLDHDFVLEYEYLNTWSGQRWLSLVDKPTEAYCVTWPVEESSDAPTTFFLLHPFFRKQFGKDDRKLHTEEVIAFVMSGEKEPPRPPEPVTYNANGTSVQLPTFAFRTVGGAYEGLYILTERRRIFQIIRSYPFLMLEPLELSQIADEHVRRRVEEELRKIARDQKNR